MTKIPSQFKFRNKFYVALCLCFCLILGYISLVGATVSNVVARQNAENESGALSQSVSELEFSYLSLKSEVTIDLARAKGFVDAPGVLTAKSEDRNEI
jgi:hypothetical protein